MSSSINGGPASVIDFQTAGDGVSGEDAHGRRWHILEERSGWRLSFRDPGDGSSTNAGVFGSFAAARHEADRATTR